MKDTLRQSVTLLGFAAIVLFFAIRLPDTFLTAGNLINITQQLSMLAVVAATMTIVMVMNDFDLSVGSMASLAGIVAAVVFTAGYPVWAGLVAAVAVGVLGGMFNGFLISGGKTIFGRDIPASFSSFARSGFEFGDIKIPFLTITAIIVIFLCWFF